MEPVLTALGARRFGVQCCKWKHRKGIGNVSRLKCRHLEIGFGKARKQAHERASFAGSGRGLEPTITLLFKFSNRRHMPVGGSETPDVVNGLQSRDHDAELALDAHGEGALGIPRQNRKKSNTGLADLIELDVGIGFLGFLFVFELYFQRQRFAIPNPGSRAGRRRSLQNPHFAAEPRNERKPPSRATARQVASLCLYYKKIVYCGFCKYKLAELGRERNK